ncbi:MAG: diguanylate cyclase [Byssovorax sp.]
MKILVAEDDAVSMLILRRSVQNLGHACVTARDGLLAWEAYLRERPDVVISDWLMPGIEGLELCRRIRAREAAPDDAEGSARGPGYTYFVFMTALGDRQHFLTGMEAGADDYLIKPVDLDALCARLIAASRVTSLHRKLLEQNAELERLGKQSHEAARVDPLTRAANRLRLREDLGALRSRVERYGHRYAAALADIDHFKRYNDAYGHMAGDETIQAVAATIAGELRSGDVLYRYGGEEFLVIFAEQSREGALTAMNRIRQAVMALGLPHSGNAEGVVTISAGVAVMVPGEAPPWDDWLKRADQALYRAKAEGRNRVCCFEPAPDTREHEE